MFTIVVDKQGKFWRCNWEEGCSYCYLPPRIDNYNSYDTEYGIGVGEEVEWEEVVCRERVVVEKSWASVNS